MGLEEVKEGLKKETEEAAALILKEAGEEKSKMMASAKETVDNFRAKSEVKTNDVINTLKRREIASANLSAKKTSLNTKKDMIDMVFEKAMEKLEALSNSERKKIITSLIKLAGKMIDVKTIYCNEKDKSLIGNSFTIKTEEMKGGVICESKDGSSRIDYTFETILKDVREDNLKNIAEKLF